MKFVAIKIRNANAYKGCNGACMSRQNSYSHQIDAEGWESRIAHKQIVVEWWYGERLAIEFDKGQLTSDALEDGRHGSESYTLTDAVHLVAYSPRRLWYAF